MFKEGTPNLIPNFAIKMASINNKFFHSRLLTFTTVTDVFSLLFEYDHWKFQVFFKLEIVSSLSSFFQYLFTSTNTHESAQRKRSMVAKEFLTTNARENSFRIFACSILTSNRFTNHCKIGIFHYLKRYRYLNFKKHYRILIFHYLERYWNIQNSNAV